MSLINFVPKQTVVTANWLNAVDRGLNGQGTPGFGVYSSIFQSGYLQYVGPNNNGVAVSGLNNNLTGNTNFLVGLLIPLPNGSNGPALLVGSGVPNAGIVTDAVLSGTPGINLYMAAGSAASPSTDAGGVLWLFGGPAWSGRGGDAKLQGGTSVNGTPGDALMLGGNSSNGPAGNAYIVAGETGTSGGNIKLIPTSLPGPTGTPGSVYIQLGTRSGSVPLWTFSYTGALFPGSQGAGNAGDLLVSGGNLASPTWSPLSSTNVIQLSLSGATSTIPIGNFSYKKIGNWVHLALSDANLVANSTGPNDVILSALPGNLLPAVSRVVFCANLVTPGFAGNAVGVAVVNPGGSIVISLLSVFNNSVANASSVPVGSLNGNNWQGSGLKGLNTGWLISYML